VRALFLLMLLQSTPDVDPLRVGVAASLRDAMGEIAPLFERAAGERIEIVLGSSGQLAAQIRYGAPLEVIISAADEPIVKLERDGLLVVGSIQAIASNRLTLVVPAESKTEISGFRDLSKAGVRRIVIGDPATVPAGQYAAQVFQFLNLTDSLRDRIVHAANVRQALAYVERGEVDAGVVYATDARISGARVRVVEVADAAWHQPIQYSAAVVERCRHADAARALIDFLRHETAQAVFRTHGFLAAPQATTAPGATSSSQPASRPSPASVPAASAPAAGAERRP
jgi:molybdate transport system substrate-binding protein